jgi:type I restriction enzyme S subunit
MTSPNYQFLSFVKYANFDKWDYKRYSETKVKSAYLVEPLGKHIVHQTTKVKLSDFPEERFGFLGVSNDTGMFDAYVEIGGKINQPYKKVENGFIAYNPYRINVGSIGIKTATLRNSYISPAYVVFSCRETLLPEYLFLLLKGNKFNQIVKEKTTGSVRQILAYENLAEIEIPIPNLDVQNKLVHAYYNAVREAQQCEAEASLLVQQIDAILFSELGLKRTYRKIDNTSSFLQLVNLRDLSIWSVDYIQGESSIDFVTTGKYQAVPANKFILRAQYGLSEKAGKDEGGIPMLRMNNIMDSEIVLNNVKYLKCSKETLLKYTLNPGDLLFNRTNSKELVGKTAVFNLEGIYTFASYLVRVAINPAIADVNFINLLFNSGVLRPQIDLHSRQVLGQANLNATEMQSLLLFPLPPLDIQYAIVKQIEAVKASIATKRTKANILRKEAYLKLDSEVY